MGQRLERLIQRFEQLTQEVSECRQMLTTLKADRENDATEIGTLRQKVDQIFGAGWKVVLAAAGFFLTIVGLVFGLYYFAAGAWNASGRTEATVIAQKDQLKEISDLARRNDNNNARLDEKVTSFRDAFDRQNRQTEEQTKSLSAKIDSIGKVPKESLAQPARVIELLTTQVKNPTWHDSGNTELIFDTVADLRKLDVKTMSSVRPRDDLSKFFDDGQMAVTWSLKQSGKDGNMAVVAKIVGGKLGDNFSARFQAKFPKGAPIEIAYRPTQ